MFKYLSVVKNTSDRFFLTLMVIAICERTIFVFPILYLTRALGIEDMYNTVLSLLYLFLTLGAISSKRIRFISSWAIFIIVFFLFSIISTYIVHPECSVYIKEGWDLGLKSVIPWFLLGTCFYADKISLETIGKWCSFGVVFLSAYLLLFNNQLGEESNYDMDASYRLLLSTLIVINYAFSSGNKFAIFSSLVGVFYSLAMGTRGPVLVIFAFILIRLYLFVKQKRSHHFFFYFAICIGIILLFVVGTTPVLQFFQNLLEDAGFSTRVFDLVLNEELLQSNSRQNIYETLISILKKDPWPHGLYAERLLGFYYAHNIYLEVLFNYGVLFGAIILLFLVLLPVLSYKKSQNTFARQWIIMLACYVFIRGIWGQRFLSAEVFFMIGFCLKEIVYYKQITNSSNE